MVLTRSRIGIRIITRVSDTAPKDYKWRSCATTNTRPLCTHGFASNKCLILNRAGSIFHFTAIPCGAEVVATIAVVVATIAEVVATIAEVFATMSSTASEAALHRKRASFNSF